MDYSPDSQSLFSPTAAVMTSIQTFSFRTLCVSILLFASIGCIQAGRIDTHIHALPPAYLDALQAAGGDPSGFPTPAWSINATIASMDGLDTEIAILSVSSPGAPIAGSGAAGRKLARNLNRYLGSLASDAKYKKRIGFFGVLPDWQDVSGTLAELDYLYRQQRLSSGVTVYTTYGGKLLGDPAFIPIWTKLQSFKALVFIHPSVLDVTPKFVAGGIPQPVIDYPLATTRTAVDLVLTGRFRSCPDVDIILSHAGGTLPYLGSRALGSLVIPQVAAIAKVNSTEAVKDFARFYFDLAVSTSAAQLDGLLDFGTPGQVLFGSDFPYAPPPAISANVAGYNTFVNTNTRGKALAPEILRANSLALLKKHQQRENYY